MAPERAPAFQFYPKDFLTDGNVAGMSLQERGAYITLLCLCWLEGSLPSDLGRLANHVGVPRATVVKLWPALARCFRPSDTEEGRLIHPRLELERQKQEEYRRRQSDAGRHPKPSRKLSTDKPEAIQTLAESEPEPNSPISDLLSPIKKEEHARVSSSDHINGTMDDAVAERAGEFLRTYAVLYQRHRHGARYHSRPALDWPKACELCTTWDNPRLERLAVVFLKCEEPFAMSGSRTIGQFAAMASWCDSRLSEVESGVR